MTNIYYELSNGTIVNTLAEAKKSGLKYKVTTKSFEEPSYVNKKSKLYANRPTCR